MTRRALREIAAVSVVGLHILLVFYIFISLSTRVTEVETLMSVAGAFLPVFGIYVGVVVKNAELRRGPKGPSVSGNFTLLLGLLFFAYVLGVVAVVESYKAGIIASEKLLPGAISFVEAAFGGFFSVLFLKLFGVEDVVE